MRFPILSLMVLLTACVGLQVSPQSDLSLQKVREVDLGKDAIFDGTLEWMAKSFTDSKEVIEIQDRTNGKIIGKGLTTFKNGLATIRCRFTMAVEIKDKKYRTTYDNFTALWDDGADPQPVTRAAHVDMVREKLFAVDDNLFASVSKQKSKKDW